MQFWLLSLFTLFTLLFLHNASDIFFLNAILVAFSFYAFYAPVFTQRLCLTQRKRLALDRLIAL